MTLYSARVPNCGAMMFYHMIDLMLSCCFVNHFTESLSLSGNGLNGTILTEVGQLTQLSEYMVIVGMTYLPSHMLGIHSYLPHVSNNFF